MGRHGSGIHPIQTHDIVIALSGIKLDGKAAWVPSRVGEFSAEGDGGKADEDGGFVAGCLQEVGLAVSCSISTDIRAIRCVVYVGSIRYLR